MSTTYTSTIEVNVWKEHCCLSCGTKYRYLFKRSKQGQGGTPDAATENAHNEVIKALEHEVDMQPCPGCGTYQPDMIASQRSGRHWWTFWLSIPVLVLLVILILADVISYSMGTMIMGAVAGLTMIIHLLFDFTNPNANLDANQRLAKDREEAGDLWVPKQPKGEGGVEAGSGINSGHYAGFAMLILGTLLFFAPAALLIVLGGASNPQWNPEVIGPGDEAYVYFNDRITSVKGYWSGTPTATILNWTELGMTGPPPVLAAKANTSSWAGTITISSKGGTTSSPLLWASVTFPNDPKLVGKKLQLRINMAVRFPQMINSNTYQDAMSAHQYNGTVTLSGVKAGSTYKMVWWTSVVVGLLLSIAGGITLPMASSAFAKKANKTEIFSPDEPPALSVEDEVSDADDQSRARPNRDDHLKQE